LLSWLPLKDVEHFHETFLFNGHHHSDENEIFYITKPKFLSYGAMSLIDVRIPKLYEGSLKLL